MPITEADVLAALKSAVDPNTGKDFVSDRAVRKTTVDGADAVMLSAETSVGKYPVEAVRFMARIAAESEDSIRKKGYIDPPHQAEPGNAEILADAAHHAARDSGAAAIVVFSSCSL